MACTGLAQRKISLPFSSSYDEEAMVLIGIQYNYISPRYQLELKKDWHQVATPEDPNSITYLGDLKSVKSTPSTGFSVAIPVDIRTSDNLYFTFNPSFVFFNNLNVTYESTDPNVAPIIRKHRHGINTNDGTNFNSFDFPIALKFRSDEKILKNKFNRYRVYMLAGARYTRWIGVNEQHDSWKNETNEIPAALILKPGYLSWEAGLGIDIFFPYFKMSPEIKFNQSINNVFDMKSSLSQNNKFMAPIEKGMIRNIYLSLTFQ